MSSLIHVYHHFRKYGKEHRILYLGASVFFFWAIFDGIVSYAAPVLIEKTGVSHFVMGLVFASSSFFGGLLDIVLSEHLRTSHYRRVLFYMLLFSFAATIFLFQQSLFMLMIAMLLWGVYYDLSTFASYDFIARRIPREEYASSFGIIDAFISLAYVIAPLLIGSVLDQLLTWKPLGISWFVLGAAFALYLVLVSVTKKNKDKVHFREKEKSQTLPQVLKAWHAVFKDIGPSLLLRFMITMY
ncbi:MAG: MFS transporter, partial [Patescibacteria group bacterium]